MLHDIWYIQVCNGTTSPIHFQPRTDDEPKNLAIEYCARASQFAILCHDRRVIETYLPPLPPLIPAANKMPSAYTIQKCSMIMMLMMINMVYEELCASSNHTTKGQTSAQRLIVCWLSKASGSRTNVLLVVLYDRLRWMAG